MANDEELPPIHRAVVKGHLEALELFLKCGGDPNLKSTKGDTPLFLSVKCEKKECMNALLEAGADPNSLNSGGNTGLHLLAGMNAPELARILLKKGASQFVRNDRFQFPVHLAVKYNNIKMTRELVSADNSAWNLKDLNGRMPWEYAQEEEIKNMYKIFVVWNRREGLFFCRKYLNQIKRLPEGVFRTLVTYF